MQADALADNGQGNAAVVQSQPETPEVPIAQGISPTVFGERIRSTGDVTTDWPFADLAPDPRKTYTTNIGSERLPEEGMLVGMVLFAYSTAAIIRVQQGDRSHPDRVVVQIGNEEEAAGWKQMVGVTLAMQATPTQSATGKPPVFRPDAIVAVEQPVTDPGFLYHPDFASDPYFDPGERAGFIQGKITGATNLYDASARETLQVEVPGLDGPVTVNCHSTPTIYTPNGRECEALFEGDVVRVEVTRAGNDMYTYTAGDLVFTLGG